MRKNILYLFYAVVSGFILLALNQNLNQVLNTVKSSKPQFVFTQKAEDNAEQRKQQELEIIRQWAEEYDPKNTYD